MGWLDKGFYLGRRGVAVRRLSLGRIVFRLAIFLVVLGGLVLALAFGFRDRFVFYPVKGLDQSLEKTGWEFEEVWLRGLNGERVNAWLAPAPPPVEGEERYTVLLLHGTGGNLTDMIGRIMTYHWLKLGVMAIDYQGYGLSEGRPSLEAAVQNAVAAWDFLVVTKKIPPEKIVVHGYSLGGGVAGQLVRRRPVPHPLVLDSTFTSLADAGEANAPLLGPLPRLVLGQAYDTKAALADYRATVAIFLHSPTDEVIPYRLSRELFESYHNGPKAFVDLQGSHVSYVANQAIYEKALVAGLRLKFPKVPPQPSQSVNL
jgi:pimeloyl-ACP methyl ester carboxylesterase